MNEQDKNKTLELSRSVGSSEWLDLNSNYLESDIERWLRSVKIRCKKSTYSNYQYVVQARIFPKFARMEKRLISADLVNNYTVELLEEGLYPKTVKDILIILQQILKYAGIQIDVSMPKVPKTEIQIFKKEEQLKLEEALLDDLTLEKFGIFFCLYTGLRIGEICALKWENIDLENRRIYIRKTITRIKNPDDDSKGKTMIVIDDPKSISSIREIPIPAFLQSMLEQFQPKQPSYYFITGTDQFLETRTYFNHYKKILKTVGLEHYNFHALRHTFATRCIESGSDPKTLSEILGHANVKITLDRYVHPNYENKVRLMNQLKPMCYFKAY